MFLVRSVAECVADAASSCAAVVASHTVACLLEPERRLRRPGARHRVLFDCCFLLVVLRIPCSHSGVELLSERVSGRAAKSTAWFRLFVVPCAEILKMNLRFVSVRLCRRANFVANECFFVIARFERFGRADERPRRDGVERS